MDYCGSLAHLIWAGLGTTPVEKHLLDRVCIGYTKAGGTLNFVYLGHRLISRAKKKRRRSWFCVNIYMPQSAPFLSLEALPICLFLPASLLLQLLYHGSAGLHGRCLGQRLSPHHLLAPLRLPPLHSGQPAAAASRRRVILAIKHTEGGDADAELIWERVWIIKFGGVTLQMLYDPPSNFFARVSGGGRGVAEWFWLDCPS